MVAMRVSIVNRTSHIKTRSAGKFSERRPRSESLKLRDINNEGWCHFILFNSGWQVCIDQNGFFFLNWLLWWKSWKFIFPQKTFLLAAGQGCCTTVRGVRSWFQFLFFCGWWFCKKFTPLWKKHCTLCGIVCGISILRTTKVSVAAGRCRPLLPQHPVWIKEKTPDDLVRISWAFATALKVCEGSGPQAKTAFVQSIRKPSRKRWPFGALMRFGRKLSQGFWSKGNSTICFWPCFSLISDVLSWKSDIKPLKRWHFFVKFCRVYQWIVLASELFCCCSWGDQDSRKFLLILRAVFFFSRDSSTGSSGVALKLFLLWMWWIQSQTTRPWPVCCLPISVSWVRG